MLFLFFIIDSSLSKGATVTKKQLALPIATSKHVKSLFMHVLMILLTKRL